MNLDQITVILGDGTKIELESGFVGGILKDITHAPMGLYSGRMNIETACTTLVHLQRAALKLATEELNMSLSLAHDFLHFCAEQAHKTELENNPDNNHTIQEHEIYLKMKQERKK